MIIKTKYSYLRPYYITVNGREYKVDMIRFYKDNSILVSSHSGWLETENRGDINSIELPIEEIKVKRKEAFNGEVYIISKGKEDYGNELIADLYIPAEMLNIHSDKKIIICNMLKEVFRGDNNIYILKHVENIGEKIRHQYEEIYKNCASYELCYQSEELLKRLDNLKALVINYIEEKQQIESSINKQEE